MNAKDIPAWVWEWIQPDPCECGQTFEQDITECVPTKAGVLGIKCPNCGTVKGLRIVKG